MTHLASELVAKIAPETVGLDVSTLKTGSVVRARTRNSEYILVILDDGYVAVRGGKYFPDPTRALFNGSTWGSSLLKPHWIGEGMNMEFALPKAEGPETVTTTAVRAIELVPEEGITFLPGGEVPAGIS